VYVRQAVKGSGQHSVSGRKVPVGATHHDPVGEEGFEGDTHGRGRLVSVILGVEIGWWCSVTYNYRQPVMFDVVAAVGVGLCRRRGTSRSWLEAATRGRRPSQKKGGRVSNQFHPKSTLN
jgi:hypothetical protein